MAEYLTEKEVAEILRTSLSTTRKWRHRGDYPTHKKLPNGSVLVTPRDFQLWVDGKAVA
jgi:hypothetical protein